MQPSRKETEIKLRFDSYRQATDSLDRTGATAVGGREFEDNVIFDTPDLALKAADKLLRLRRAGGRAILTLKAPVPGESRHKVREEYETEVLDGDAVERLLQHLGLSKAWRYQKYRTKYRLGSELDICVDETPVGCYVELEGEPAAIDRVATDLGFTPDRYVLSTYRELQEAEAVRLGEPAGDMLLAPEESTPGP